MNHRVFATAINCMDGRVQIPVIDWLKKQYNIDYVDMITHPGPEQLLAEGKDQTTIGLLRKQLEISITCHKSNLVAVAGHHDCAGNPTDKHNKREQILTAIKTIKSWNSDAKVIGLWIDENWDVNEVK